MRERIIPSTAPQRGGLHRKQRRLVAAVLPLALLLAAPGLPAADGVAKRKPKNALEDIERVGNRNVTGIFNMVTLKEEIGLGRNFAARIDSQVHIVRDPVIAEYVNRIGQNIGRNSDLKVPLVIRVVRDESINAFALPGGYFYVNTGLIQFARDEAELAGVMGHEIAHIAGRHGTRQLSRGQMVNLGANVLLESFGGDNWGTTVAIIAANVALPMTFLKFSRTFEKKADFLGMQYLYKTGYDPLAMVSFFERLSAQDRSKKNVIANAFRSHPVSAKRAALVQKAIDELLPERPAYEITGSEFDSVKARIDELYGSSAHEAEEPTRPKIIRRLSGDGGAAGGAAPR